MVGRNLIVGQLGKIIIAQAFVRRFADRFHFGIRSQDYDHAGKLALVFIEIFFVVDGGANAFALDHAVCAGRPCFRIGEQSSHVGRGHANVHILVGPTAAEWTPGLKMRVRKAHRGKLVASPLISAFHVGRAGEALADGVHQSRGIVHHLGVVKAFIADASGSFQVDFFLRQTRNRRDHKQKTYQTCKLLHESCSSVEYQTGDYTGRVCKCGV